MEENKGLCLYVGNIPYKTTEDDLRERMEDYGPVKSIKIFTRSGYGFVYFTNIADAEAALELNGQELNGRQLRVDRSKYGFKKAKNSRRCTQETKIYVGNIPYVCDEDALKEYFSTYGEILNVQLVRSYINQGQSRGFAFLTFKTFEGAQDAIKNGNGAILKGRKLKVNSAHDKIDYTKQKQERDAYNNYYYWHMYESYVLWRQAQETSAGYNPYQLSNARYYHQPLSNPGIQGIQHFGGTNTQQFSEFALSSVTKKSNGKKKKYDRYRNIRNNQVSKATKKTMKN